MITSVTEKRWFPQRISKEIRYNLHGGNISSSLSLHQQSFGPATHQTIRLSLTPNLLWAPWGSGARKDQRGYELTLTMEETVSSRLESETEQKTLHHCSAKTLTASDLGPGLPRSTRGGTEAREVRERLHRHPSTILPKSLHPWDGRMNHGWPSARPGPGPSPPTPHPLYRTPPLSGQTWQIWCLFT